MDLFKNYQREFDAAIAQTSKKLGQLPTYTGGDLYTILTPIMSIAHSFILQSGERHSCAKLKTI